MIGIVVVTHGQLADEFRSAVEHVVGPQENFGTISIGPDDDIDQRRQEVLDAISAADSGKGVVVLTDMFGGTPSNLAISVMDNAPMEVLAGANLPMLIKLVSVREDMTLPDAVRAAAEAGRKYISVASDILSAGN